MKRLITLISFIIIAGIVSSFTGTWWLFCLVAFALAYFSGLKSGESFLVMALGGLLLWGGYAFILNSGNDGILSSRIAETFRLPSGFALILLTALIGGLLSAFSGLSGALLNRLTSKKTR